MYQPPQGQTGCQPCFSCNQKPHQLATIHRFLKRAVTDGEWDNNYKAGHRLAHYEQSLTLMAKVLNMPYDWIPAALQRSTATKMTDTDWTMGGLSDYIDHFKLLHGTKYITERFSCKDIVQWAEGHEAHSKNSIMVNSWKLAKYVRSHKGSIQKNLKMVENGSLANKLMYSVE